MSQQVKSRKQVNEHGEVFTAEREVNAMLDLVKQETERIDSRFLEPACGNGNFLAEVLRRKLAVVEDRYSKNQIEFERYAIIAISSIYGVDILEDNAIECRERLYKIFEEIYTNRYKKLCKDECLRSIKFILDRNILWGDALDFTNPLTKTPIIFSEWSAVNGSMIKRRDFIFKFLVEKTHQFSLFNDQGDAAAIDEPVRDFPLVHFLKLSESGFAGLEDSQD
ncbi:MAG: SAM-dependent DNA methyltransferase [Emticicia sp.]|uniref:SAM-dependent DNA methyltransferase n=1 Tax=Emticicia sp. TaxID=1930953 RepID=UPI003BA6A8AF